MVSDTGGTTHRGTCWYTGNLQPRVGWRAMVGNVEGSTEVSDLA